MGGAQYRRLEEGSLITEADRQPNASYSRHKSAHFNLTLGNLANLSSSHASR